MCVYIHGHTCPGHTGSPRQRPQFLGKPSHSKHLCLKAAQFMSCQCWGISSLDKERWWDFRTAVTPWGALGISMDSYPGLEGIQVTAVTPAVTPWGALGPEHPLALGLCCGTQLQTGNVPFPSDEVLWKTPMRSWKEKIPQEWEWFFFLLPFVIETELQQIVLVCKCQVYCSLKSLQS